MDLYSRRIIGCSLGKRKDTALTLSAINKATKKRKPEPGVIFHTDRGIEFRSYAIQKVLNKYDIMPSMNRPFHSIDNTEMESFYKTLKGDVILGRVYRYEKELRREIRSYINHFYNTKRLHSSLGYRSPIEYESMAA